MRVDDMMIRRLGLEDMDDAALVFRKSFDERLPWLAGLHTPDEDRGYWAGHLFPNCEIFGAERAGVLAGVVAFRADWIDQLYVLPGEQGRGIGSSLVDIAKAAQPRLCLWTFQRNTSSRQFYEARGFVAIRQTDGADNEEKEPDVLYQWLRNAA